MASAEDLGKKLLAEVEEVGLDEIFSLLRAQVDDSKKDVFGFQPLDQVLQDLRDARPNIPRSLPWPTVELISLHPQDGETHLLYHLCAQAVLPVEYSGRQSCTVILDADSTFSVQKLAGHIQSHLHQRSGTMNNSTISDVVLAALMHIHVFYPQSLASTTATIDSLPSYLFNGKRHRSFDRKVGFIALHSASAFYWQDRAEAEDAAFRASTAGLGDSVPSSPSGYVALATALKAAIKNFDCPIVFTSRHLGSTSTQSQNRSYRSPFPASFAALPTLRLIVQRAPIRKFPADIALEAARREASDRQGAVSEGKFVCFVNEWGLDERTVQRLNTSTGEGGFSFRVLGQGVVVEKQKM